MKDKRLGVNSKTRGLYAIPDETVPSGLRCLKLQIPDSDAAMRMLFGALYQLTYWQNYERDAAHKAREWGNAWSAAIAACYPLVDCESGNLEIRACESNCGIEYSTDGINWTCIDLTGCISDIVAIGLDTAIANGILDAINDGTIQQPGGQQNPDSAPGPDSCKSYHVILRGNDRWLCPVPVGTGNSITVTNAKGGWCDGSLAWYCPDGARYLGGVCSEQLHTHQEGDLLNPDAWHMEIIASVNDAVYGNPVASAYVVPEGYENAQLWLQANDGSLSDNQGQVEFDVEVCNSLPLDWYHEWNLMDSQGPWALLVGYWDEGTGFHTSYTGSTRFEIDVTLAQSGHVTYVRLAGDYEIGTMSSGNGIDMGGNHYTQVLVAEDEENLSIGFLKEYSVAVDVTTNIYLQMLTCYGCSGGYGALRLIGIGGTGQDPFGA